MEEQQEAAADQIEDVPKAATYEDPKLICQGTIQPHPDFSPDHIETVARDFQKAFKGIGTDENRIIRLLTEHSNEQRQEYIKGYSTAFGRNLIEDIKDELSGNFEDLCLALLTPARIYDARSLKRALEDWGTMHYRWTVELLCPRTNDEIKQINETYQELHKSKVEDDVKDIAMGDYEKILVSVIQGNRAETKEEDLDMEKVQKDAKELYDAGEGKLGTDEEIFTLIFGMRSFPHLKAICKEYEKIAGRDLEDSVKREFSSHSEEALLAIVQFAKDPHMYFAERIASALKDDADNSLTRLIVSHSETDLANIATKYELKYKESLLKAIKRETRGDFRKLLLRIVDPKQNFK